MRILLLFWLAAPALCGAYSNLIATSDGKAVYFQVPTGPVSFTWYVARQGSGELSVTAANAPLADVDGTGSVLASAATEPRFCGFGGSSCWTANSCEAVFQLQGPGFQYSSNGADTFVRLSRSGQFAWIVQGWCGGVGWPRPSPMLNGLYDASSLKLVAALGKAGLANSRYGRRAVTDLGQALTLEGPQLGWLDATGAHPIRNVNGAFEAVTDQQGANVVYVEAAYGRLHWVTGTDWLAAQDLDLGLSGSAPALTDDGSSLLFLDAGGTLQLYDRATAAPRRLGADTYLSFTLGGGAVFAVTPDGRLMRIDPGSGESSVWLAPFLEITSIDVPEVVPDWCTYICYGDTEYAKLVSPGMIVRLEGKSLGGAGWRARSAGLETPLAPIADTSAWFQIPSGLPATATSVEIYNPAFPISYSLLIGMRDLSISCFGTLHQDFSRPVTSDDPAAPGEVVHIFMTGLKGVEAVADGVPNPTDHLVAVANPPALSDPGALDTLFFGLAPGLIGIQQMDALVHYTGSGLFSGPGVSADYLPAWGCSPPPVAAN